MPSRLLISLALVWLYPFPLAFGASEKSCYAAMGTTSFQLSGSLDESSAIIPTSSIPDTTLAGVNPTGLTTTFDDLRAVSATGTYFEVVYDDLGISHQIHFLFFHVGVRTWQVRGYVLSEDVDPGGHETGLPRQIADAQGNESFTMTFDVSGNRSNPPPTADRFPVIPWNDGATASQIAVAMPNFTTSNATSVLQAGVEDGGPPFLKFGSEVYRPPDRDTTPLLIVGGNLPASSAIVFLSAIPAVSQAGGAGGSATTFAQLGAAAGFYHAVFVVGSDGRPRRIHLFGFHTGANAWTMRLYADSETVDPVASVSGLPRLLTGAGASDINLTFNGSGRRTNVTASGSVDLQVTLPWNDLAPASLNVAVPRMTQLGLEPDVCSSEIDYCPLDENKLVPGVCGCGVADVVTDGDGVPDCVDIPDAPKVRVIGKTVLFRLERFRARVIYMLVLTKQGRERRLPVTKATARLAGLAPGGWHVRYTFQADDSGNSPQSRYSRQVGFTIPAR
jgi:hypothetical protein